MSKRKQSRIADFFSKTSKHIEPETLTEAAEQDDTRPQDSKMGQSYNKNVNPKSQE